MHAAQNLNIYFPFHSELDVVEISWMEIEQQSDHSHQVPKYVSKSTKVGFLFWLNSSNPF